MVDGKKTGVFLLKYDSICCICLVLGCFSRCSAHFLSLVLPGCTVCALAEKEIMT